MYNLRFELWDPVTTKVFGARSIYDELKDLRAARKAAKPLQKFDWNYAIAEGHRLIAERAPKEGFASGEPRSIAYDSGLKAYGYGESVQGTFSSGYIAFVPETGQVLRYVSPIASHESTSFFIERWLRRLHTADSLGAFYQTFVAVLGLVITMFSVTGVYLWWKKYAVRRRKSVSVATAPERAGVLS